MTTSEGVAPGPPDGPGQGDAPARPSVRAGRRWRRVLGRSFTARTLVRPSPAGCTVASSLDGRGTAVTFTWTVPGDQPSFSYEVRNSSNAVVASSTSVAGSARSVTYTRDLLALGNYTWSLRSSAGTLWTTGSVTGRVNFAILYGSSCSWDAVPSP